MGRKRCEFYKIDVRKLFVLYSTENEDKPCVIERFNPTIKDTILRYFTTNSTRKYIDVLYELVDQYNNTVDSLIKMSRVEASLKNNEKKFLEIYIQIFGVKPNTKIFSWL